MEEVLYGSVVKFWHTHYNIRTRLTDSSGRVDRRPSSGIARLEARRPGAHWPLPAGRSECVCGSCQGLHWWSPLLLFDVNMHLTIDLKKWEST